METLENILEIKFAINVQKVGKKDFIPELVKSLFKFEKEDRDIGSKLKINGEEKSISKVSKELFEEKNSYNIVQQLSDYISLVKDKLYDYYSAVKDTVKETVLGFKTGYTDIPVKQ